MPQNVADIRYSAAINAMICGGTQEDAAHAAGVARKTICRWLEREDFIERLERERQRVFDRTADRMVSLAEKAMNHAEAVLDDPDASRLSKDAMARLVLDAAPRFRELGTLGRRVEQLAQAISVNIISGPAAALPWTPAAEYQEDRA